jgi:hypothetical protein
MMTRLELQAAAKKKWESSGLEDGQAAMLKLDVLTSDETAKLNPSFIRAGSIRIPYFAPSGDLTGFYRIRYLEDLPGFAGVAKKPQRYAQPPKTLNDVYLPPMFEGTWQELMDDPAMTLYITEGEFKAASACAVGLPCMGLGGVDVWRSSKRGLDMLPVLKQTDWNGRRVVIVFDSDAATNPNVVRAQRQLAQELTARGAMPVIASLPAREDGGKQGLDDFLMARGATALEELLATAPLFLEAEALWGLNEEVVYVRDPGMVITRVSGQKMMPGAFKEHVYSNRHYLETQVTKKTQVTVKKPLAPRWMEWERRFELERVVYEPGKDAIVDNCWNQWRGWGCEPKEGDVEPWTWLLDFLFQHEESPDGRIWFEQWLAYPLQHPGVKMFTAAAIWGVAQGTGKTLVGHSMMQIYGTNAVELRDKDLKGGFNDWAENRQFVVGDEITGNDRRDQADMLKGMITQQQLRVNIKYLPSYTIEDRINYLFTSNHPDAFFLEDSDRRFFVHEVQGEPAELEKYKAFDKWRRSGGASALFHHLLTLDLDGFDPKAPAPSTNSKSAMIRDNKSDIGAWCMALREEPDNMLRQLGTQASEECALFSAAQLQQAYDPESETKVTTNGLARELKRAGFRQVNDGIPVRTLGGGLQRLYAVRDANRWTSELPNALAAHWDTYFGPKAKKF